MGGYDNNSGMIWEDMILGDDIEGYDNNYGMIWEVMTSTIG